MSEYLSKKAVLEWLDDRRYKSPWIESFRERLESGAFDADNTEIQRLRTALEMARSELRWGDPTNAIERVERIIDEALSTAGLEEPTMTDREKKIVEIREALEKATPGPWKALDSCKGILLKYVQTNNGVITNNIRWQDAELIANAPEWLRFLLDELERLERLNEMLQEEIQRQRAALEEVRECLDDFWDHDTPRRLYKEVRRFAGQINVMEKVINQAISTAIEPTNAANAKRIDLGEEYLTVEE